MKPISMWPVRLIGAGIHLLHGEEGRQLSIEDVLDDLAGEKEAKKKAGLRALDQKYGIDFTGHEAQLYTMDVLHRTIEYMRKHRP